jgi:hypothetical protein
LPIEPQPRGGDGAENRRTPAVMKLMAGTMAGTMTETMARPSPGSVPVLMIVVIDYGVMRAI